MDHSGLEKTSMFGGSSPVTVATCDRGSDQAEQGCIYHDCNLRCDTSFIDPLTGLVSYAHVFRADYHVSFLDAEINATVDDMISPDFCSSRS